MGVEVPDCIWAVGIGIFETETSVLQKSNERFIVCSEILPATWQPPSSSRPAAGQGIKMAGDSGRRCER